MKTKQIFRFIIVFENFHEASQDLDLMVGYI